MHKGEERRGTPGSASYRARLLFWPREGALGARTPCCWSQPSGASTCGAGRERLGVTARVARGVQQAGAAARSSYGSAGQRPMGCTPLPPSAFPGACFPPWAGSVGAMGCCRSECRCAALAHCASAAYSRSYLWQRTTTFYGSHRATIRPHAPCQPHGRWGCPTGACPRPGDIKNQRRKRSLIG